MLTDGIMRSSTSDWASPVVLDAKEDGSLLFCVNYRRLNAVTKLDYYPLPRMDERTNSLGDACYFTTLNANSGSWKLPMKRKNVEKTAFVTHRGLFECLTMPFGPRNAPASFQNALDIILASLSPQNCLVYIDDVIIFSETAITPPTCRRNPLFPPQSERVT